MAVMGGHIEVSAQDTIFDLENNIMRLPVDHVHAMNCVVLARRELDAHDSIIMFPDTISLQ
jgi:hypothetical protein